jgi:hypothetical protein
MEGIAFIGHQIGRLINNRITENRSIEATS